MQIKNPTIRKYKISYGVKFLAVFLAGSLLSACAQGVSAKTPMNATVDLTVDKTSFNESEDVILHVVITNPNSDSVKILKWFTPVDGLERSLFNVLLNGEPLPYLGKMVKRAPPTEQDYITLLAGESIASDVNLSEHYAFSVSDQYEVTYDVASLQLFMEQEIMQLSDGRLTSNTLNVFIKGRPAPAP